MEEREELRAETEENPYLEARFKGLEQKIKKLKNELKASQKQLPTNALTIIVFSGDMDRLMASFILSSTAAAMGMEVTMFFTMWGLVALKKSVHYHGKTLPEKMITFMMPSHPKHAKLSKMNMLGGGKKFLEFLMKKKNIQNVSDYIEMARNMGVKFIACSMTMDLMGIKADELLKPMVFCGATTYLANASTSKINLFI